MTADVTDHETELVVGGQERVVPVPAHLRVGGGLTVVDCDLQMVGLHRVGQQASRRGSGAAPSASTTSDFPPARRTGLQPARAGALTKGCNARDSAARHNGTAAPLRAASATCRAAKIET